MHAECQPELSLRISQKENWLTGPPTTSMMRYNLVAAIIFSLFATSLSHYDRSCLRSRYLPFSSASTGTNLFIYARSELRSYIYIDSGLLGESSFEYRGAGKSLCDHRN